MGRIESQPPDTSNRRRSRRRKKTRRVPWRRRVLYSLIPVTLLLLATEVFFRVSGWAKSPITPMTLPGEEAGIYRFDPFLFWSLKPNQDRKFQQVTIRTNSLGLRSEELGEKAEGEIRVLSLGESTTFGAGVENHQTYAAVLQSLLNRGDSSSPFQVINAGVSAYTSFQSLMYLKTQGLQLKPDVVLFYHEINDFSPTYVRASDNTVIGMGMTDRERLESRSRRQHRALLSWSATYRFIAYRIAYNKIRRLQRLPPKTLPMELAMVGNDLKPMAFPMRVSPQERRDNFTGLLAICRREGIQLVIIHPTYRESKSHECLLTRFCQENQVPMLETHPVLHPEESRPGEFFWDNMHPTAEGHRRLGVALYKLLIEQEIVTPQTTDPPRH